MRIPWGFVSTCCCQPGSLATDCKPVRRGSVTLWQLSLKGLRVIVILTEDELKEATREYLARRGIPSECKFMTLLVGSNVPTASVRIQVVGVEPEVMKDGPYR